MTESLLGHIHNDFVKFIVLFAATITIATVFSYVLFYIEKKITALLVF